MKFNNADLKAAFLFAAETEFLTVPDECNLNHSFSSQFVEWGLWIITYRFPVKRVCSVKRVVRAVLIAAIIMALLAGTALAF